MSARRSRRRQAAPATVDSITTRTERRERRKRLLVRVVRGALHAFLLTSRRSAADEAMAGRILEALEAWEDTP